MISVMATTASAFDDRIVKVLAAIPLVLSSLVLAAHFYRGGALALVVFVLIAPLLVATRERSLIRVVQFLLILGAAEWIRTASVIAEHRAVIGAPVTRMFFILGAVALLTLLSALPLPRLARS